jgi:hypothetical protein
MIKAAIGSFIDTNFIEFEAEIGSIFHYRLSAKEIINHLAIVHPEWKIGKSTLIKIFAQTPYKTLNSYLSDKYGKGYKWRNSLSAQPSELHNHKVIDVEFTDITMDVGTLTVDGNNDFHDYHNYALSAGIFVMNSRGTEISTLPGGENLGAIDDVEYFQRKLYKALDVPISRLEPQQGFSLGRGAEITRDELKFMKFVDGLRRRFSRMIDEALKTQLILKGVLIEQDWEDFREHIYYDFLKDIAIAELKNQEVWRSRFEMATIVDPFVGKYISAEWVRKQVLQMTDEEIQTIEEEIAEESTNPRFINPMLNGGIGGGPMGLGGGMDGGGMGGPGGPPMMDQNGMPMGGGGGPGGNPFDKLSMGNVPNSMNPNAMNAAPQKGAFPKNNRFQNGKDGLTAANGPKKRLPKIGVKKKLDRTTTSH